MDIKKNIWLLIFIGSVAIINGQENRVFIPPDMTQKIHTFTLPEYRIDSNFITKLNTILLKKEICGVDNSSKWKHFHITFEIIDSLNYSIYLSLWDIPARKSTGFFEYNEFFYWLGGEIPPNIILETKSKKQFSYNDNIPAPYDPPFWILMYYSKTGNIEFKEKGCY